MESVNCHFQEDRTTSEHGEVAHPVVNDFYRINNLISSVVQIRHKKPKRKVMQNLKSAKMVWIGKKIDIAPQIKWHTVYIFTTQNVNIDIDPLMGYVNLIMAVFSI